tara:strand:- start:226 stop:330 length:105 start_codon:yes stop_codon:yes gene_type:complete
MRKGGRVVEGARLESVYAGDRIVGSNPILSAKIK